MTEKDFKAACNDLQAAYEHQYDSNALPEPSNSFTGRFSMPKQALASTFFFRNRRVFAGRALPFLPPHRPELDANHAQ